MPIGKIEAFDLHSKQWPAYVRRVEQFILLNEIKDELKVPTLITVVGDATYSLMCDLCAPEHPETKSFDTLVQLVSEHLEPQRSEIAERHIYRQRRQRPGETLTEYLQSLKHLATTCNFTGRLEEELRDQFVSGMASEAMRSRIFAEKNIKYKKAVELALALEAAERHAVLSGATSAAAAASASGDGGGGAGEALHAVRARRDGGGGGGGGGRPRVPAAGTERGGARPPGRNGGEDGSTCWRCGKLHRANKYRFANYNCDLCNRRGHLKVMCPNGDRRNGEKRQHYLSDDSEDEFYNMEVSARGNEPYFVDIEIDGLHLACEIDTGSRISAINELCYERLFKHKKLQTDNLILRSYSGSRIEPLGFLTVNGKFKESKANNLCLYVIKGGGRPLLGRDWLSALGIKEIRVNQLVEDQYVSQLCMEYPEVFTDKLGTCKKTLNLELTNCDGVYMRARPVPLALRERVERELERLERDGTIYRVDHSDFGTPIVPVVKKNGELRLCGDYKITINPKLKRDFYPLPRIEELFANLSNGEEFTKIDLRHAYEQVMLTENSQRFTAITTHIGTFAYRRTPYGLSCVPEKFQKLMEETLRGVPGTVVFLDDICVTGRDRHTHLRNLRMVLERLRQMGLTVKREKCRFLQKKVHYLGFVIDKNGLHPDPTKLDAITNLPSPTDVTQLKSFLGLLNYYGKFIPNLSTMLHPLHALLKKNVTWSWDNNCELAFRSAKKALVSDCVLAHYEEGRALVLSVDSSAYGVGAVLAHRYADGSERPVSCASRTLNDAEKHYSQLDKEALAIFYGVTKHHQYLFGRKFVLRTDHKPLMYILGEKKGIPQTAASRLQRWAARLAGYDYKIEFVRSADNGPADSLSRLPLPYKPRPVSSAPCYNMLETIPINFKDVAKETKNDGLLSRISGYIMFGWPLSASKDDEKAFFARKDELYVELGCILFKYRIVIPKKLQGNILEEIHTGHLGMNKMKSLARNYVYWPNIDKDIEATARACAACAAVRDAPAQAPLHPWEFPLHPWMRLHADFFDYANKRFLIIVDAHSKWMEVMVMSGTTAKQTIKAFRSVFARFGLPSQLVTDNGPPFSSEEFNRYCTNNAIRHTTSAPYRPQGNGEAENAVKTAKKAVKRATIEGEDVLDALSRFLFQYRNSEHATTGMASAVALLGRRLRGRLDAIRPDRAAAVRDAQRKQVEASGGRQRHFENGQAVLARDYTKKGMRWSEGQILASTGPVSYKVDMGDGSIWRRHQDQIIPVPRNSSRFSLSRAEASPAEGYPNEANSADKDSGAEVAGDSIAAKKLEMPEYAAMDGAGSEVESDYDDAEDSSGQEHAPLPPAASARYLRAHRRANKKQ